MYRMYQAVTGRCEGETDEDGFRTSYFVDISGYCATGPFPWLGLQMCGQSLHEHLRKHGPMVHGGGPGAVFRQLAAGLAHMHKRNIAHLDLKTGNLLWDAADRHLHIIDLGMAERFPAAELYYGEYCTPPYRPPELWGAAAVEHRRYLGPPVDIWSAGCVMYEVTTAKFFVLPSVEEGDRVELRARVVRGLWLDVQEPAAFERGQRGGAGQTFESTASLAEGGAAMLPS
jgi:hypothetical protein